MKKNSPEKFNSKLRSYSAIAGSFIAVNQLSAQGVYSDITPDTTVNTDGGVYNLDLNNDGTFDFTFKETNTTSNGYPMQKVGVNALNLNEVAGSATGAYIYPTAMNNGDTIQSSLVWNVGTSQSMGSYWGPGYLYGQWLGVNDKYIGLKLNVSGTIYYGWARLDVDSLATSFTIKDYAYQSAAGQYILAGSIPLGINDHQTQHITIYNNNRTIHILANQEESVVSITNAIGQTIRKESISSSDAIILMETEKAGIYFINVRSSQKSYTKKIVIN